jgi:hypothetical protein
MAREHARVLTRIWEDPDFCALPLEQQRLYFLLLSRRNLSACGVVPLQVRKWARCAPDTTVEDVERVLHELEAKQYVFVDADTEEVLVRTLIRNDGVLKVPNVFKAALRQALSVEAPKLRQVLAGELRRLKREDAAKVADELFPIEFERDPDSIGNQSEPVDNPPEPVDNSKDSVSIAIDTERKAKEGVGEGGKEPLVGGSVGRSREREEPPPLRCPKHQNVESPPPCRGCGEAREARERWNAERTAAIRAEVRKCGLCDSDGRRWDPVGRHRGTVGPCDHRSVAVAS